MCQVPQNLPCSVTLQPGPEDSGKACGVDYELQAFCAKTADEKIHHRYNTFQRLIPRLTLRNMNNTTRCRIIYRAVDSPTVECVCRNSLSLVIRKVQYAPEKPGVQPTAETRRNFLMSDRSLHLEASLDKEVTLRDFVLHDYMVHTLPWSPSLSSSTTTVNPSV